MKLKSAELITPLYDTCISKITTPLPPITLLTTGREGIPNREIHV